MSFYNDKYLHYLSLSIYLLENCVWQVSNSVRPALDEKIWLDAGTAIAVACLTRCIHVADRLLKQRIIQLRAPPPPPSLLFFLFSWIPLNSKCKKKKLVYVPFYKFVSSYCQRNEEFLCLHLCCSVWVESVILLVIIGVFNNFKASYLL